MAILVSDDFSGSGSVDGHTPDVGGGVWAHQGGYPPTDSALGAGGATLSGGASLVYADYVDGTVRTARNLVVEFDFYANVGADSNPDGFVASFRMYAGGDTFDYGVALYSYFSGYYNPPKLASFGGGLSDVITVGRPAPGVARKVRIEIVDGVMSISYGGDLLLTGPVTLPTTYTIGLTFKLVGYESLRSVTVDGWGAGSFWTNFRNSQEVS